MTEYCECGQEAAIHILTKKCLICDLYKRGEKLSKRRPELKRMNNEARIKFSTKAKLQQTGRQLEKEEIWFRVSSRHLIIRKSDEKEVKKLLEDDIN